ncbi:YHS domain-containing (seleno)protein [Pseudovibrio sp. SCP19]|uniref:YHS domain-containing (seleno)protein n=1 Tax=Pseudovibrio sp. SCP19 TaxID=3141374 RepID=UPI00333B497B
MKIKSIAVAAAIAGAALSASTFGAFADEISTYTSGGYAIGGTDPVAYFTENKPVQGKAEFTAQYDGVTWKFSSAENRDKFVADPVKFAPQYGGWCAVGASFGSKLETKPELWDIVDGKLYLNAHDGAVKRMQSRTIETITNADANWVDIRDIPADKL